ncbi:MAG: phosphoglucosamine mutase [Candidatus Dependentiae bacterium]|nr:phosphoglucosamine mutase [Candidatus Dependentiae bacterium]
MKHNIFGTDGIRGLVGAEPFSITSIIKLGMAIGAWAQKTYGTTPVILLGHDTRESCSLVKAALQTGLLLHKITIYDAQVVPTPTIYQLVTKNPLFNLGIIISASHNPYHDNGIKLVDAHRGKLSLDDELKLSELFYAQDLNALNYTALGTTVMWEDAQKEYCATLAEFFPKNFLQNTTIVLDCAHGATYKVAHTIFQSFGAQVMLINHQPTGTNINQDCGALHLESLQHAVTLHHADAGFAFDGDGDRVMAVSRLGQVKNGDDILALLLTHPLYENETGVVGTVMTNQGFEVHARMHNKELLRANVGDKYVAELLEKKQMLLGGEQSGHIIVRDYLNTGDGIFTALRTLQAMIHTNNWDMETFEKFPQILINVPITVKKDLTEPHLAKIITEHEAQLHGGRVLVRYSGTELLLRIMIEDSHEETAHSVGNHLSQELIKQLSV